MRSNYKRLGLFIREVVVTNDDLSVTDLRGVNVGKVMMPSKANIIGTDLSKYKIARHHQFVYGPVTSRNGERIAIALVEQEECILSVSYTVFEIIDREALLPEYLMMWFKRPEFDRYARFMSHGSVREIFGWEELCDVELPVPSPEKQREIVAEYETVVKRIALNERLGRKLEETAQAIYKHWFVDFEFPMSAEDARKHGKPELEGKPYQSSGGEMMHNEMLNSSIPAGWQDLPLGSVTSTIIDHRGKTPTKLGGQWVDKGYPAISAKNIKGLKIVQPATIRFVDEELYSSWMRGPLEQGDVLMTSEAPLGELYYVAVKTNFCLSQRLFGIRADKSKMRGSFLVCWLQSDFVKSEFDGRGSGTTVTGIRQSELRKIITLVPEIKLLEEYDRLATQIRCFLERLAGDTAVCENLRLTLLSGLTKISDWHLTSPTS